VHQTTANRGMGRLMERYDLRSCFQPDLAGLHVSIYQFRELLREHLPTLSAHLDDLQVDPVYVSQWFLSFFAVTCPLPMLFRIYDVIFAEGAPETLMRVALSLMRKNEGRIIACTELEDVMQLLLSRGLWDCYHYNADELVEDFVDLTGLVTREKLSRLQKAYRESIVANNASANAAGGNSDVTTAASRFLGRIWASTTTSSTSPKPSTLSPGLSAPSRPLSMLRRSASKQSLASTLNSMEASSVSVVSTASTEATSVSRDSSNTDDTSAARESAAVPHGSNAKFNSAHNKNAEDRYLHSQIEDLLTALSELQRNQALLESQLQRERQERDEDRRAVRTLLDGLKKKASSDSVLTTASVETVKPGQDENASKDGSSAEIISHMHDREDGKKENSDEKQSEADLSQLLDVVEQRFGLGNDRHRSSMLQSKSQLREDLAQAKDKLASSMSQSQEYSRRIYDLDQEVSTLKDQLRESHTHVRSLHQDKQRLEKQIHGMRVRASAASEASNPSNRDTDGDWGSRTNSTSAGGLRELKLGRSKSTPSQQGGFSKRTSSLPRPPGHESTTLTVSTAAAVAPTSELEALLLELVQAKTAEAIAKQEAEEAKQKLETLRKAYGLAPGDVPPATGTGAASSAAAAAASTANAAATAAMGVFGRLTASVSETGNKTTAVPGSTAASTAGGFWGGWRR
jgi:hypothetical protein